MTTSLKIRPLRKSDRAPIEKILHDTKVFVPAEIEVACELLDIALNVPDQKDYRIFSAVGDDDHPVGYVCYGPTPCTDGTWDLYWIAVDPTVQGKKIGKQLLEYTESAVRADKARMLLIETSSLPRYEGTRAFYTKNGYVELARVKDFYHAGDDKVILGKRFAY